MGHAMPIEHRGGHHCHHRCGDFCKRKREARGAIGECVKQRDYAVLLEIDDPKYGQSTMQQNLNYESRLRFCHGIAAAEMYHRDDHVAN